MNIELFDIVLVILGIVVFVGAYMGIRSVLGPDAPLICTKNPITGQCIDTGPGTTQKPKQN